MVFFFFKNILWFQKFGECFQIFRKLFFKFTLKIFSPKIAKSFCCQCENSPIKTHTAPIYLGHKCTYFLSSWLRFVSSSSWCCGWWLCLKWLQALLNPGTKFKSGDERWAYALQTPEPSVCFALCCGGWSDPAVIIPITRSHSQF